MSSSSRTIHFPLLRERAGFPILLENPFESRAPLYGLAPVKMFPVLFNWRPWVYAVAHAQLSNGLAEIVFLSLIASQNIQSRLKADPTDRKLFPAAFLAVSRGISIDPRPGYTGFVFALCWKIIFERKGRGFSLSRYRKGRGEGIIEPISSYSRNYFQTEDYIFSLVVFNVEKILKILLAP